MHLLPRPAPGGAEVPPPREDQALVEPGAAADDPLRPEQREEEQEDPGVRGELARLLARRGRRGGELIERPRDLDLGKPESFTWAVDVLSGLIEDYDIDWYEEDLNIEPNPYLETAAEPNRWGMNEMRFVEGHFAFWDALLKRFPKLAILNCASGGRRIDLETLSRGQPLWRSDYNCFPEATPESTQDHSYGILHWLPSQGSMIRGWSLFDTYEARCALSPGMEHAIVAKTEKEWLQIKANVVQGIQVVWIDLREFARLLDAIAAESRSPKSQKKPKTF